MSKIVPKLNLNKTPQAVENNSLVYARNIKLLPDGSLVADTKQEQILLDAIVSDFNPIAQIVGLDNKIYFLGYIEKSGVNTYRILEFDEITHDIKYVNCSWKYNDGKITGCVTINNTGTKILTVCEYGGDSNVPIKHIPIETVNNETDIDNSKDESHYTQTPAIPFLQLSYKGENSAKIRSGVYQFFVRYEISGNIYTNWFPCSKDLYTGDIEITPTVQGGVSHCDTKKNSFGFDFYVTVLDDTVAQNYTNCQIGCIISTDGASVARIWKTFKIADIKDKDISFSYSSGELKEVDIDEMLASTFDLYNVGNIDVLKNRLYVANYNEDNVYDEKLAKHVTDKVVNLLDIERVYKERTLPEYNSTFRQDVVADTAHLHYWFAHDSVDLNTNAPSDAGNSISLFVNLKVDNNGRALYGHDDYEKLPSWSAVDAKQNENYFVHQTKITNRVTLQNDDDKYSKTFGNFVNNNCFLVGLFVECIGEQGVKYFGLFEKVKTNNSTPTTTTSYEWLEVDSINTINTLIYTSALQGNVGAKYKQERTITDTTIWSVYCEAFADGTELAWNKVNKRVDELIDDEDDDLENKLNPDNKQPYVTVNIGGTKCILQRSIFGRLNRDSVDYRTPISIVSPGVKLDKTWFGGIDTYSTYSVDKYFHGLVVAHIGVESKTYIITTVPTIDKSYVNTRTLLPSCKYDFYIHFVKEDGVTTPGYYIKSQVVRPWVNLYNTTYQFYPIVSESNDIIPTGYKYAFLSVARRNPNVLFVNSDEVYDVAYSIDDNAMLHTPKDDTNFYVIEPRVIPPRTMKGSFVDSYDTNNLGCVGVYVPTSGTISKYLFNNDNYNVIADVDESTNDNASLVRITPYFGTEGIANGEPDEDDKTAQDIADMSLPGFICANVIPDYLLSKTYYAIDTDIYQIINNSPKDIEYPIENKYTPVIYHYSYYNTTLVSSVGGLNKNRFKTWIQEVGGKTINTKSIINTINSQEISYFLQLDTTYKDFIAPIFDKYDDSREFDRFDTVVRRSTPFDNENLNFTYRFESSEYYPIPANRGKIVNLVSFADKILIHLEQALLAFDANNLLNTNEQNVTLAEGDPFIQGISFIEDGNYGKAGLVKKEHARLGNNYYVFFDKHENRIYIYDGQSKLQDISIPILKLLECVKPNDAVFAIDDFGGRFFVNLIKNDTTGICLSYSIYGGGFISIHDFKYIDALNTKNNSYIIHHDNSGYYYFRLTNEKNYKDADNKHYEGAYYPTIYRAASYLQIQDFEEPAGASGKVQSIIDVICNDSYEVIKVLNNISWICNRYNAYDHSETRVANFDKINIAEEQRGEFGSNTVELFSATKIRIYSDQTYTPLLTLTNEEQDAYGVENKHLGGYQPSQTTNDVYPRYNNGIWTLNDFRDIKQMTADEQVGNISNSLVHGKYFVVRFIFEKANFKLENVIFKMNNYEKV